MTEHSGRLRVLLIEHNRILLEGLSRLLSELPDMELAGVTSSASAGVALFEQKRPAVTVIDLELPDTTAAGLVRQIRQFDAGAPILILATYELDPAGADAIVSGAAAVIAKDQIASMLVPLIRSVASATP
jgi:two-component system NarL family response regulator